MLKKATLSLHLIMLALLVLLQSITVSAATSGIQDALDKKISLELKNVLLKEALDKIGNLAEVSFIYAGNKIIVANKVDVSAHNEKVGDLLKKLLKPLSLSYTVLYDRVVIRPIEKKMDNLTVPENNR